MKLNAILLPLSILLLLVAGSLQGQNMPDSVDRKVDGIFKEIGGAGHSGCAVAIVSDGKIIFEKGYGMANLEYDISITPSTVFDIASLSKQFTGFAISTLVQQGRLSADDDIHKYLPDVPQFGKTITIRHLLHHISGLRDWPEALFLAGWREGEVFSFQDIMRMVKYQKDLDFEPGSQYSYSNTGYNLLAAIVEKVTGKTFRAWTDENIFQPLGMNSSHFLDNHTRIIKNLARSYYNDDKELRNSPSELTAYGSSSLFTSADDLCKWVINFQKQVAAQDPVYARMLEHGKLNDGKTIDYGYGIGVGEDRGLKVISHTGAWAGYRTIIRNFPDEKLSIIILSNTASFDPSGYAERVADIFLKTRFKTSLPATDSLKNRPLAKVDTTLLKKYTGIYQLGPGWTITLTLENGQLMTQANGESKFAMEPRSDSSFWVKAYGASITFVKARNGEVDLLRYRSIQAKRILHPWTPGLDELRNYTGSFYSTELETEYKLDITDNKLTVHHMRAGDFAISPDLSGRDRFGVATGGIINFTRNNQQKITGFTYSWSRVKNIRFDRMNPSK